MLSLVEFSKYIRVKSKDKDGNDRLVPLTDADIEFLKIIDFANKNGYFIQLRKIRGGSKYVLIKDVQNTGR